MPPSNIATRATAALPSPRQLRMPRTTALLVGLALYLAGSTAYAQSGSDSAIAEALFRDGRSLLKAGNASAACPKFEESYRIEPRVGTLLNLAQCHADIGRTASAWTEFTSAAATARREGQSARVSYATEQANKLDKLLTRVTIRHEAATPGLVVRLGRRELEAATLGTALPVDPGEVTITARADGKVAWSKKIQAPAGPAQLEVIIPPLEDAVVEGPAPSRLPSPSQPEPAPVAQPDEFAVHPLVWIGVAVGAAGVIAGSVTGGLALSRGGSLDCPNDACAPEDKAQLNEARTLATVSNASFVVTGAAVAVTAVGLVLTFSPAEERDTLQAEVGLGWVGVRGAF